jgi:hypothetical protein
MTKKFTQEELLAAYEQMKQERHEEYKSVEKAVEWLAEQGAPFGARNDVGFTLVSPSGVSPFQREYKITLTTAEYGNHESDYDKALEKKSWAKKLKTGWQIKTPHGTYGITFRWFDHGNW